VRPFAYFAPATLDEALETFRREGEGGRPLGGGTDLVVQLKEGGHKFPYPRYLVSVRRLPELRITEWRDGEGLLLGAAVTMAEVCRHPLVQEKYSVLVDGASLVGSWQTMNMATVGGNVCNAAPSADTASPLLVLGAKAHIVGLGGERVVPLEEFFLGPGRTVLSHGDILVELLIPPPPPRCGAAYARHTPRARMDIAVVGVAALLSMDEAGRVAEARIALAAVAPTPIRARRAEAALVGRLPTDEVLEEAARLAREECSPISDVRGSAAFRRYLVGAMTKRMLQEALARAGG
jgi:CO/xanthine dehydrogenase FAD-binding subunit